MKSGFTLVELLISIAIFIIITSVAVLNNSSFNASILLTDLGYQVALSVRQAQVYGITVKAPASCTSLGCLTGFSSGYGVDFNIGSGGSATSYILFEDGKTGAAPDHIYQPAELLQTYTIGKGYSLKQLCVGSGSSFTSVNILDISFIRPEPEARVAAGGVVYPGDEEAHIYIQDPTKTTQREILIEPTGQVSVQNNASHC